MSCLPLPTSGCFSTVTLWMLEPLLLTPKEKINIWMSTLNVFIQRRIPVVVVLIYCCTVALFKANCLHWIQQPKAENGFYTTQIELASVCKAFFATPNQWCFFSLSVLVVNGFSSSQSSAQRSTKSSTPSPTSPRPISGFKVKRPTVLECGPCRCVNTCYASRMDFLYH